MDEEKNNGNNDTEESLMNQLVNNEDDSGFIMLVNMNIDNKDYWAYLMLPARNYDAFMEAQSKGLCNIKEYGDVVEWGEGIEPPPDILKKLEAEYGIMPQISDNLHEMENSLEDRMKRMGVKSE